MATGANILEEQDPEIVVHGWFYFETGDEAVDGSCVSAAMNTKGETVGLFRFKYSKPSIYLRVSATVL